MTEAESKASDGRTTYWDEYYENSRTAGRPLPSQFAAFVASELLGRHRVIEFGCGTGRDSLFFASYGHDVIGVDASKQAIESCFRLVDQLGDKAHFLAASIGSDQIRDELGTSKLPTMIYARFFIHAITDAEEVQFFELAAQILQRGDAVAVEYRTIRDAIGEKVTADHYRRFVNPAHFQAHAASFGFDVSYSVEGFGFAKYKSDDAYVARCVLIRR